MLTRQNKFIALLLIAAIGSSSGFKLDQTVNQDEDSDKNFKDFLEKKMSEYGQWLKDERLDPSFEFPETIPLSRKTTSYLLNCDIKNQVIQHHSQTGDVPTVDGSLTTHVAALGREVHQPYEFTGEYNCNGVLYAEGITDLETDLFFNGAGKFVVKVNSSDEFIEVVNLGIKEDNTFDLTNSWTTYFFNPDVEETELDGSWNSTDVSTYIETVKSGFSNLYKDHLRVEDLAAVNKNPSRALLQQYTRKVLREANLADIVEGDLPPPYSATPSEPTTTPTDTTSSSTSSTPTSPNTSSKPTTATESSATSIVVNFGTASWTVLFALVLGVLTPKA